MTEINASLIKELRDKTGVGILKCRKALTETNGDMNAAVEWLRKQDVKVSVAERVTQEGIVSLVLSADGRSAALAEMLCETDFAARNESFKALAGKIVQTGLERGGKGVDDVLAMSLDGLSIEQGIKTAINTIGENIRLKRFARFTQEGTGRIGSYVHGNNKLGVLVALKMGKPTNDERLLTLLKHLAMHIAGAPIPPVAMTRDAVDKVLIQKERSMILDVMNADPKDSKKPENIKEKIVDGKMNRFFGERVLPEQAFVMDDKKTIKDVIAEAAKALGDKIEIAWFERWALGQ